MLLSERKCESQGRNFNETFSDQFVLSKNVENLPKLWEVKKAGEYLIAFHPRCKFTPVFDQEKNLIGQLLGVAIDKDGRFVFPDLILNSKKGDPKLYDEVESFVEGCAGRFILFLLDCDAPRLYFDAIADYSACYNSKEKIVASTPGFATTNVSGFDPSGYFDEDAMINGSASYIFGISPDKNISFVRGNHYLDLNSYKLIRHWPNASVDITPARGKVGDATLFISKRLQSILSEIVRTQPYLFALSGGRDSRVLLGCSLASERPISHCYSHWFHHASKVDMQIAQKIASHVGIAHISVVSRPGAEADIQRFLLQNGHSLYGSAVRPNHLEDIMPQNQVLVRGNVMGLMRAINWRGQSYGKFNINHALKRLRAVPLPERHPEYAEKLRSEYQQYYSNLPEEAKPLAYDFAWLETQLTQAQGVRHYSTSGSFVINPFTDRALIAATLRIPPSLRFGDEIYDELLRQTRPDLMEFEYN